MVDEKIIPQYYRPCILYHDAESIALPSSSLMDDDTSSSIESSYTINFCICVVCMHEFSIHIRVEKRCSHYYCLAEFTITKTNFFKGQKTIYSTTTIVY